MNISIEIVGFSTLQSLAERYPAIAEKYVNRAINRSLVRVMGAEKQEAPFGVSGILRDQWKVEMGRFEGTLRSLSKYALYVEKGTGPHMPPIDAITPWAKKKGINPWAVAMSIKKKGTKANPFFERAINDVRSGIDKEFDDAIKGIIHELGAII